MSFAGPDSIMKAHDIHCCDAYGAMLWKLRGKGAESFFKAWNTAVKLTHWVPRSTYTYLVEGFLANRHTTLRNQVLGRYPGFLQGLLKSPSPEVQFLARVVLNTPGTTTWDNMRYVEELTGLSPRFQTASQIKVALPVLKVPEKENWRLGLLTSLLKMSKEKHTIVQDSEQITAMTDRLCST